MEKPVPVLISLIQNPHACSQATETVAILKPKAIVNIFMHCVQHLQKVATNVLTYTLQNIINTIVGAITIIMEITQRETE